jgi:hypothetical protein
MTRYLISFPNDAMDHIPDEEGPEVGAAAHAVIREAQDAGSTSAPGDWTRMWIPSWWPVAERSPPAPPVGGITIIDVPSREAALEWATKIAAACRCPQEVSEFGHDPAVGN